MIEKLYESDGTLRIKGNHKCLCDYTLQVGDIYQYGCEYEFYIETSTRKFDEAVEDIKKRLFELTKTDILVNLSNLPNCSDRNHCMQIKPDSSLDTYGVEISIPITTLEGAKFYTDHICQIINEFGYTNEETGMHIHISTIDKNGVNFNFYKYMLICHDAGLLSSWKPRPEYSMNVMDILSHHHKLETRKIKTKKGSIWNLEREESNHVEIKSIGGENYHLNIERLLNELDQYASLFHETLQNDEPRHQALYVEHQKVVDSADQEVQKQYIEGLFESGIMLKE
jgi:hypothetical protein